MAISTHTPHNSTEGINFIYVPNGVVPTTKHFTLVQVNPERDFGFDQLGNTKLKFANAFLQTFVYVSLEQLIELEIPAFETELKEKCLVLNPIKEIHYNKIKKSTW